jgi:hypothetical protein
MKKKRPPATTPCIVILDTDAQVVMQVFDKIYKGILNFTRKINKTTIKINNLDVAANASILQILPNQKKKKNAKN